MRNPKVEEQIEAEWPEVIKELRALRKANSIMIDFLPGEQRLELFKQLGSPWSESNIQIGRLRL